MGGLLMPLGAAAQAVPEWTLSKALEIAFENSPVLRGRQAEQQEVASRVVGARTYPYNPEVSLEFADRSSPAGSATDRGLSISQEFELAGQRSRRIAVADQELAAAEAVLARQGQLLAFHVESAFAEAVMARELLGVATTDADLSREVLAFSQRRLERGAATQIEVNLAQASAGRAERSLRRAQADYASARSRLAEIVGTRPQAPPEPVGDLLVPEAEPLPLEDLLALAFERRGDLLAAGQREQAAEAAIRLATAEGKPNLVVGGFFEQEEETDDIVGVAITLSVPLFNRNQGRIAESRATRERSRYDRAALRLAVEQEVVAAFNSLQAAGAAAEHLRDQVLGTLDENVELLQRSFEAGRIGATEVVTLRREFVASRREYIEALADAWLARIELNLAIGRLSPPQHSLEKEPS
ncbi:MAG: TolC family protein [Acidobacteriota bacterium]|nr:TolC family protein [Acidobacteriota bacterium]